MFFKEKRAQGALEYLLMIGGAILIAAIVIALLVKTGKKAGSTTDSAITDFNNKIQEGLQDINFKP